MNDKDQSEIVAFLSATSYPHITLRCPLATFVPCVRNPARLDEQQLHLILREWLVLNPLRNDEHFTLRQIYTSIAEIDTQVTVEHDEGLVPFNFHNLELVVIHLGNDL